MNDLQPPDMCACVFANEENRAFYIRLGFFTLGVETQPLASLKSKKTLDSDVFFAYFTEFTVRKRYFTQVDHMSRRRHRGSLMGNSLKKKAPACTPLYSLLSEKSGSIHTDSRSRPQRQFLGHVWSLAITAPCTSFSRLAAC